MVLGITKLQDNQLKISFTAELADVLRKRRHRPDASDEDLGLPHSPASPRPFVPGQRNMHSANALQARECSSTHDQSCLSIQSGIDNEIFASSTTNNSLIETDISLQKSALTGSRYSHRTNMIGNKPDVFKRHSLGSSTFSYLSDELDGPRLTHAGAKHKMALRPSKKKAPSRLYRRTIDTSIPEVNEDIVRVTDDAKTKTRSLPSGVTTINPKSEDLKTNTQNTIQKCNKENLNLTTQPFSPIIIVRTMSTNTNADNNISHANINYQQERLASSKTDTTKYFLQAIEQRKAKRLLMKEVAPKKETTSSTKYLHKPLNYDQDTEPPNEQVRKKIPEHDISDCMRNKRTTELNEIKRKSEIPEDEQDFTFMSPEGSKPKSGPAARQRFAPKSISAAEYIENSVTQSACEKVMQVQKHPETFKSTAIVRSITQQQQQQKNIDQPDKVTQMSQHSPLRQTIEDQKSHHGVEKSHSFRGNKVTNGNMTSALTYLPKRPTTYHELRSSNHYFNHSNTEYELDKSVSLGFEINDNNLMRPPKTMTRSASYLNTPEYKPVVVTSCNRDITEIEQNIDRIVKSPFVSVTRRTAQFTNEPQMNTTKSYDDLTQKNKTTSNKSNRLSLTTNSNESNEIGVKLPETAEMLELTNYLDPIRKSSQLNNYLNEKNKQEQKLQQQQQLMFPSKQEEQQQSKQQKQQAKPQPQEHSVKPQQQPAEQQLQLPEPQQQQLIKQQQAEKQQLHNQEQESTNHVPEFMKVQLNRISNSERFDSNSNNINNNIVLVQNNSTTTKPKESSPTPSSNSNCTALTTTSNNSTRSREASLSPTTSEEVLLRARRFSNESMDISEKTSPELERRTPAIYEAINGQPRILNGVDLLVQLPAPKTIEPKTEISIKKPKPPSPKTSEKKKSLQELKMLFLNDESKVQRVKQTKIQEKIRTAVPKIKSPVENKTNGSLRKVTTPTENKKQQFINIRPKAPKPSAFESWTIQGQLKEVKDDVKKPTEKPTLPMNNVVQMRKKANTTIGGNRNIASKSYIEDRNFHFQKKDKTSDSTPELMKVFARRSLKVKDEDINTLAEKIVKFNEQDEQQQEQENGQHQQQHQQQHVDSDKENHCTSEENIKEEKNIAVVTTDFRKSSTRGFSTYNKSNGDNNNNLTTIKLNQCSNNGSNNNNNNGNMKINNIRQSYNNNNNNNNQQSDMPLVHKVQKASMERAATVGEFKGIHQRRAEWEQRAKEALK